MTGLRYCRAKGATFREMRENISPSLYKIGDAILIWVNEGDFWLLNPPPTDTDEVSREDAILAEADAIRARRANPDERTPTNLDKKCSTSG